MKRIAVLAVGRTPFTGSKDGLSRIRADEAASVLLRDVYLNRLVLSGKERLLVLVAHAITDSEQGFLFARSIVRLAGLSDSVPAWSVSAASGSGVVALSHAVDALIANSADVVIVVAADFPTRTPPLGYNPSFSPKIYRFEPRFFTPVGLASEYLVSRYRLVREELDEYANESRRRALAALDRGDLRAETVAVNIEPQHSEEERKSIERDQLAFVRNIAELSAAEPIYFKDGALTALNTAHLADGAVAVALSTDDFAEQVSLEPVAHLDALQFEFGAPEHAPLAMMRAVETVCDNSGINIDEFDYFEVDEPASSVVVAFARQFMLPLNRINTDGGALAYGFPLAASALRAFVSAAVRIERGRAERVLVSTFAEGGMGFSCILNR